MEELKSQKQERIQQNEVIGMNVDVDFQQMIESSKDTIS
jgi:hypothetical protein